jgi:hypothetical protein
VGPVISPWRYVGGALAIGALWGGLAALAVLVPVAAAAVLAALALVMVLVGIAAASLALRRDGGQHGGGQLADLPRVPDPGRWAPPRNPDRAAAEYESYTIPGRPRRSLDTWE